MNSQPMFSKMGDGGLKCVVLQPGYLPWAGFFDQMIWADVFVIYDDVQYTRRDWRSRNRIKTAHGAEWLTVPVVSKGKRSQLINEVEIDNTQNWEHKHLERIRHAYARAPYFADYFQGLAAVCDGGYKRLIDLDMALIRYFCVQLAIDTRLVMASSLSVTGRSTERLVNICLACGADKYLTGDSAADYLDLSQYEKHDIEVVYHQYKHPSYPQLHGEFIPYLSVIDLLLNCGPESRSILKKTETLR